MRPGGARVRRLGKVRSGGGGASLKSKVAGWLLGGALALAAAPAVCLLAPAPALAVVVVVVAGARRLGRLRGGCGGSGSLNLKAVG